MGKVVSIDKSWREMIEDWIKFDFEKEQRIQARRNEKASWRAGKNPEGGWQWRLQRPKNVPKYNNGIGMAT